MLKTALYTALVPGTLVFACPFFFTVVALQRRFVESELYQ